MSAQKGREQLRLNSDLKLVKLLQMGILRCNSSDSTLGPVWRARLCINGRLWKRLGSRAFHNRFNEGWNMLSGVKLQPDRGGKSSLEAFKGFGPPPSKTESKSKKRSSASRSQPRLKQPLKLKSRGGLPDPQKRAETAEDAQIRIHARAASVNRSTAAAQEATLRVPAQEASEGTPYGPRGLLLVGFEESDFHAVKKWFQEMEPDFRVSCCSDELLSQPLEEAISESDGSFREQAGWQKPVELVPHAAMFSGLTQEEYFGLVQFWETTGIRQPIFVSVAESTANKTLRAVLLEISKAYARSIKPDQPDDLNRESLRQILRERMAAKENGEAVDGPVFL